MYSLKQSAVEIELILDGIIVAHFYCAQTADLVCNLLNVTRMAPISSRLQAG